MAFLPPYNTNKNGDWTHMMSLLSLITPLVLSMLLQVFERLVRVLHMLDQPQALLHPSLLLKVAKHKAAAWRASPAAAASGSGSTELGSSSSSSSVRTPAKYAGPAATAAKSAGGFEAAGTGWEGHMGLLRMLGVVGGDAADATCDVSTL
jgi:hypothetical protein